MVLYSSHRKYSKRQVRKVDPWNPLYNNEAYARSTRWGTPIAHPFLTDGYVLGPEQSMLQARKGYFTYFYLIGHESEYYQPIRLGDTIRVWRKRPILEDSTDLSGKGPRMFRYVDGQCDYINQRDEIVGKFAQMCYLTLYEGAPPVEKQLPDYGYTQKELDHIIKLVEDEKLRGSQILFWEDVKVGDSTPITATGPINLRPFDWPTYLPTSKRAVAKYEEPFGGPIQFGYIPDRKTGLIYMIKGGVGRHADSRASQYEGGRQAWGFNFDTRDPLIRAVTNWMGDDGFITKFTWRHVWRTPLGDNLYVNGKVVKKYVENGEHLVDMKFWCLDMRGCITDMSYATVKLVSKNDPYPPVKKIISR